MVMKCGILSIRPRKAISQKLNVFETRATDTPTKRKHVSNVRPSQECVHFGEKSNHNVG